MSAQGKHNLTDAEPKPQKRKYTKRKEKSAREIEHYDQEIPEYLIGIANYDGVLTSEQAQKIYKEAMEKKGKNETLDVNNLIYPSIEIDDDCDDSDYHDNTPKVSDNDILKETSPRTGTSINVGKPLPKEKIAVSIRKPTQNITTPDKTTHYRALIGVPEYTSEGFKAKKSDIEKYQLNIIKTAMQYWNVNTPVEPYPDFFFDPDKFYLSVLNKSAAIESLRRKINVDDPIAVLNYYGPNLGKVFYQAVPDKWRGEDKRTPSKQTGVITYSIENPDGMYKDWRMPISFAYNGIDIDSSKLVNKNYGTCNDMIVAGDIDWDATYVPEVGFIMYSEPTTIGRRKTMKTVYEIFETSDGEEMGKLYLDKLGRFGMVAMVECDLP